METIEEMEIRLEMAGLSDDEIAEIIHNAIEERHERFGDDGAREAINDMLRAQGKI